MYNITWQKEIEDTGEVVRYVDDDTREDKTSTPMTMVVTPDNPDLPVRTYALRKNILTDEHIKGFEYNCLLEWATILNVDPVKYKVDEETLTIVLRGKVDDPQKIEKWLKPNGMQDVEAKDAETL